MTKEDLYKLADSKIDDNFTQNKRFDFIQTIFEKLFIPKIEQSKKIGLVVDLYEKEIEFIENFVSKKVMTKEKEWQGCDMLNSFKRNMTGAIIEFALLKFYNKQEKFDCSITSKSHEKYYPDLMDIGILTDIKGCSWNSVPLVMKKQKSYLMKNGNYSGIRYKCSNIICVRENNNVIILGIASPKILSEYTDENLVGNCSNPNKTGFWGVNELLDIPNEWNNLIDICNKNVILSE